MSPPTLVLPIIRLWNHQAFQPHYHIAHSLLPICPLLCRAYFRMIKRPGIGCITKKRSFRKKYFSYLNQKSQKQLNVWLGGQISPCPSRLTRCPFIKDKCPFYMTKYESLNFKVCKNKFLYTLTSKITSIWYFQRDWQIYYEFYIFFLMFQGRI